ncbi:Pachytene checkpoint protein 2 [Glycine soja]
MSAHMVTELTTDQNGAAYQHSLPVPEDKVLVPVEVTLKPSSTTKIDDVGSAVEGSDLSEEGPCEDISSDDQSSSFNEWILPAKEFDGMWERFLLYSTLCFSLSNSILLLFF